MDRAVVETRPRFPQFHSSIPGAVPSSEVIERINEVFPLEPVPPAYPGETSTRWRYLDGGGEIGVISSVTQSFCHSCSRARVSVDGKLFTCLFATEGHDLRALMRGGCSDEQLAEKYGADLAESHRSVLRIAQRQHRVAPRDG